MQRSLCSLRLACSVEQVSYIDFWLDALCRDKRQIFVAAGAAQKAANFVLGSAMPVLAITAAEEVAVYDDKLITRALAILSRRMRETDSHIWLRFSVLVLAQIKPNHYD